MGFLVIVSQRAKLRPSIRTVSNFHYYTVTVVSTGPTTAQYPDPMRPRHSAQKASLNGPNYGPVSGRCVGRNYS